ncbi:MAG: hypothetical protein ABUL54_07200 [Dongia sp.]
MTTGPISPTLLEALNTLLSFHTSQSAGGKLVVREDVRPSDADPENRRRYHAAWRVVAEAAAPKSDPASAKDSADPAPG